MSVVDGEYQDWKGDLVTFFFFSNTQIAAATTVQEYNRGILPGVENAPLACGYTAISGRDHEDGGTSTLRDGQEPCGAEVG